MPARDWTSSSDSPSEALARLPTDATHLRTRLQTNDRGQVLLVRIRGHAFANDWVAETFRSVDGGLKFRDSSPVPVIDPADGCPVVGFHPSENVDLAWVRGQDFQLFVSTGGPCER